MGGRDANGRRSEHRRECKRRTVDQELMQQFEGRPTFVGENQLGKPQPPDCVVAFTDTQTGRLCERGELCRRSQRKLACNNEIAWSKRYLLSHSIYNS